MRRRSREVSDIRHVQDSGLPDDRIGAEDRVDNHEGIVADDKVEESQA